MKLLNLDGSEFGDAPEWLVKEAPGVVGAAFALMRSNADRQLAFVRLSHGIRFYAERDKRAWVEAFNPPEAKENPAT